MLANYLKLLQYLAKLLIIYMSERGRQTVRKIFAKTGNERQKSFFLGKFCILKIFSLRGAYLSLAKISSVCFLWITVAILQLSSKENGTFGCKEGSFIK
jgi:hypothetical protein